METRKEIDLEMVKGLMNEKYHLIYIDYNDNLNEQPGVIRKCLEKKSRDHLLEKFDYWYGSAESDRVYAIIEELKKELVTLGYRKWEAEKFFDENDDEIEEEIYSRSDSDDVTDLLENSDDIPVRIEMLSNYDCINSHWFESSGGYGYEESYFGDMVDALNLNPRKVKEMLVVKGETVYGRFPNKKNRDDKEQVSYEQFYEEILNSTCGANLLTYVAKLNLKELYEADFKVSKVVIPKGNKCGIYSTMQGGGSLLDMELLHDVTIDLERKRYPNYRLETDESEEKYFYSIKQVYGVYDSFYGKSLSLIQETAGMKVPA